MKPKTLTVNQKHQIYFTYLLLKRKKKKKNQIYYDLFALVETFFFVALASCTALSAQIYERERERERERESIEERDEKQKVIWELLLNQNVWM